MSARVIVFMCTGLDVRGCTISMGIQLRFNLSRHIYVALTNMSFCERLSYNSFNSASIIFTIVFLNWYDLMSYSIVLPFSIFALVFLIRSIC